MLPGIALLVACYVLFRLADAGLRETSGRRLLRTTLTAITIVVALGLIVDAISWQWKDQGAFGLLRASRWAGEREAPVEKVRTVTSERVSGGPFEVTFQYLGARKVSNTALERQWIVLRDSTLPVKLNKDAGIKVLYKSGGYSGDYRWIGNYSITVEKSVSALEIKFLLLDVWGDRVEVLKDEIIEDLAAGSTKKSQGEWRLFPENDAVRYYASVAYVSRVRLQDGKILEADQEQVLEEIRKFAAEFKPEELEPRPVPGPTVAAAR